MHESMKDESLHLTKKENILSAENNNDRPRRVHGLPAYCVLNEKYIGGASPPQSPTQ